MGVFNMLFISTRTSFMGPPSTTCYNTYTTNKDDDCDDDGGNDTADEMKMLTLHAANVVHH